MALLRWIGAMAVGASLVTGQALAQESLFGTYQGKIKAIQGYSGQEGDACTVIISASERFKDAVSFEIKDALKLDFEGARLASAMQGGAREIRLTTPGGSTKPVELVFIKLSSDGKPMLVRLQLTYRQQHRESFAACAGLTPF